MTSSKLTVTPPHGRVGAVYERSPDRVAWRSPAPPGLSPALPSRPVPLLPWHAGRRFLAVLWERPPLATRQPRFTRVTSGPCVRAVVRGGGDERAGWRREPDTPTPEPHRPARALAPRVTGGLQLRIFPNTNL